jgi:hypothetical protein
MSTATWSSPSGGAGPGSRRDRWRGDPREPVATLDRNGWLLVYERCERGVFRRPRRRTRGARAARRPGLALRLEGPRGARGAESSGRVDVTNRPATDGSRCHLCPAVPPPPKDVVGTRQSPVKANVEHGRSTPFQSLPRDLVHDPLALLDHEPRLRVALGDPDLERNGAAAAS